MNLPIFGRSVESIFARRIIHCHCDFKFKHGKLHGQLQNSFRNQCYFSDFRKLCMQSTEFHFTDLDKQICAIEQVLSKRPCRTRTVRTTSVLQRAGVDQSPASTTATTTNLLQTGMIAMLVHQNFLYCLLALKFKLCVM